MTEKRFVCNFQGKKLVSIRDTENNCNVNILQIVEIVNKLSNENKQLKSTNMEMEDYIGRLEEQIIVLSEELNYIQNSITDKIKNQKTKIGEKALRGVIEDYNEWMLGHKWGCEK